MVIRFYIPLLAAFLGTGWSPAALQMQSQPAAQCPAPGTGQSGSAADSGAKKQDKASQCATPSSKDPSTAERFPFPGESPAPPMPGGSSPAPDAPVPQPPRRSAAEEHPFPDSAPPMPGAEGSSSSSSSSADNPDASSSSSSDGALPDGSHAPLDDKGDNPRATTRRRLPKVEKLQSDEERAAEDVNVAKFYEASGDLNAAYLRARDAVKYQPSDPESHYILARIAQKMKKRDEAIAEYGEYLRLEPDGEQTKQAHKALGQLQR